MTDLKASPEVQEAVKVFRKEIERIWEPAWRFTYNAMVNGIKDPAEFTAILNSNPVLCTLWVEMQHTVSVWHQAGLSVDEIPPRYSVKYEKLENLLLKVEA
jgi:hypothetical protein